VAKRVLERKREGQQRPVEPDQELEALKQSLRDRAQVIAQRESELEKEVRIGLLEMEGDRSGSIVCYDAA